jgi:hypothetical protein
MWVIWSKRVFDELCLCKLKLSIIGKPPLSANGPGRYVQHRFSDLLFNPGVLALDLCHTVAYLPIATQWLLNNETICKA